MLCISHRKRTIPVLSSVERETRNRPWCVFCETTDLSCHLKMHKLLCAHRTPTAVGCKWWISTQVLPFFFKCTYVSQISAHERKNIPRCFKARYVLYTAYVHIKLPLLLCVYGGRYFFQYTERIFRLCWRKGWELIKQRKFNWCGFFCSFLQTGRIQNVNQTAESAGKPVKESSSGNEILRLNSVRSSGLH